MPLVWVQGPDTLGALEDVLQVYLSTPLGTGIAQLSLPLISSFLQASCLSEPELLARPYRLMPHGLRSFACSRSVEALLMPAPASCLTRMLSPSAAIDDCLFSASLWFLSHQSLVLMQNMAHLFVGGTV